MPPECSPGLCYPPAVLYSIFEFITIVESIADVTSLSRSVSLGFAYEFFSNCLPPCPSPLRFIRLLPSYFESVVWIHFQEGPQMNPFLGFLLYSLSIGAYPRRGPHLCVRPGP